MKNKVLVIDNYDSFTYNLVHYMEDLDFDVTVVRNDEFSMDFVENFDKILISPKFIFCEIDNAKNTKKINNISFLEIKNSLIFLKKLKIAKNKRKKPPIPK